MLLVQNLREMERFREAYWLRYPGTSPAKLRLTLWGCLVLRVRLAPKEMEEPRIAILTAIG
jgi:hypothetical protein